ncbi:hypothetical protein ACRAWD_14850 [Caulobacter segnis]
MKPAAQERSRQAAMLPGLSAAVVVSLAFSETFDSAPPRASPPSGPPMRCWPRA